MSPGVPKCYMNRVFTGQVELGEAVSADDVQNVEHSEVDGEQDDTQQSDNQHLEPTRYLTAQKISSHSE